MDKIPPEYATGLGYALAEKFLAEEDCSLAINDPSEENVVISASSNFIPEDGLRWVQEVMGDGTDPRRVKLAEMCRLVISEH